MTGAEIAALAPALAGAGTAGAGAAAAGAAGAGLGAGALGAGAAGAGLGAGALGAGAAGGLTAAEAAALGAGAAETAGAGGLLAGGEQAAMLAAQNAGLGEMATGATNAALASNQQAAMLAMQNQGLLGATEATNAAADPAMTQGMKPGWMQSTKNYMSEKPFGQQGPSRGKLLKTGGKMVTSNGEQKQGGGAPAQRQVGGQLVPTSQASPYGQASFANPYGTPEDPLAMYRNGFLGKRYF